MSEQTPTPEIHSPQPTEVGMGEWHKSTEGSRVLETKGLGPCIGIAVYDPATKTGHMTHIANPLRDKETITAMLDSARRQGGDVSQFRVWVRGGQPHPADNDVFSMSGLYRQAVHDNLASAGFTEGQADIQFDDAPMESRSTHLRLDTELGTFEATSPNSHLISTIGQEALSSSGLPSTKAPGQLA